MALYALGDLTPEIDPSAFVHPDAVVIGNVHIGAQSSIWPTAVLRGDHGTIRIGARTSIQDGTVVHCTAELDTVVGDRCVVVHRASLEMSVMPDDAPVTDHRVQFGLAASGDRGSGVPRRCRSRRLAGHGGSPACACARGTRSGHIGRSERRGFPGLDGDLRT